MMWDAIAILTGPQNLAVRDQGVCCRPRTSRLAVVLVSSPSGILALQLTRTSQGSLRTDRIIFLSLASTPSSTFYFSNLASGLSLQGVPLIRHTYLR
jgi:hypothetical protein